MEGEEEESFWNEVISTTPVREPRAEPLNPITKSSRITSNTMIISTNEYIMIDNDNINDNLRPKMIVHQK